MDFFKSAAMTQQPPTPPFPPPTCSIVVLDHEPAAHLGVSQIPRIAPPLHMDATA